LGCRKIRSPVQPERSQDYLASLWSASRCRTRTLPSPERLVRPTRSKASSIATAALRPAPVALRKAAKSTTGPRSNSARSFARQASKTGRQAR
jgi:hypothetical protein